MKQARKKTRPQVRQAPLDWPEPLAEAAMCGLVGEIVRTIAPHTEADPVSLLLQTLVAFGNVVGRRPHFKVEADYHAPNLFIALVGKSARGRKGTSWGYIFELFRRADKTWAKNCIQPGLSTGEGLIQTLAEKETSLDPEKRLLIFEDELSAVLRVMTRHSNTLSTTLRHAWDGRTLQVMRRDSPVRVRNAHISINAQSTQHDLDRYLGMTDVFNGFANRFLWGCVQRSKFLPEGGSGLTERQLRSLARRIKESVNFAREQDGN